MNEKGVVFARESSGLRRELSWFDVFLFVVATPAASGITYYSVSTASEYPGASMPLGFAIGLLMFLPICALLAMTSAAMPRSGGVYVCVSRILDPTVGFLGGWLFFVGNSLLIGILGYVVMGIMGGIMESSGLASGLSGLSAFGQKLQTPTGQTIAGILWVAFFWLVTLLGIRWIRNVMRVVFAIPLISTLIIICYFLFVGPNGVEGAFNKTWGDGVFQAVLNTAQSNGWATPSFSWSATVSALLVVIWAYVAFECINYAGGEVKTPNTSMVRGFIWGCLGVGLLYIIVAFAVYYPFKQFIGAYDFLYDNHQDALRTIMPAIKPSVPFYAASIIGNVWFGMIIAAAVAFWYVNTMPPVFLANSRLMFAMAMDRALPDKIANVHRKTNAPTWAAHLTGVFGLLGVFLQAQSVGVVLGIASASALFIFWAFGLSGMLLPYLRPEIYERSALKYKILGVPLIVILGLITFAEGWFFVLFCSTEFTRPIMLVLILTMVVGMIGYLYQQSRNRKQGIDVSQIYSQIPPE